MTDTRGGQLLVFSVDPVEREAYPVPESPGRVAGSPGLVWVSQTAANTVVGYDLATGIPRRKGALSDRAATGHVGFRRRLRHPVRGVRVGGACR